MYQFLHLPLAALEKGMQTDKASLFLIIILITYPTVWIMIAFIYTGNLLLHDCLSNRHLRHHKQLPFLIRNSEFFSGNKSNIFFEVRQLSCKVLSCASIHKSIDGK